MAILKRILGLMLILVLVSACSSSTRRGSWANPDYVGNIKNVYLVGFTQEEIIQRIFEDSFASELINLGVNTVSSYRDLQANKELNQEELMKTMAENGFDSVLFNNVVNQRSETVLYPGYVYYGGRGGYYRVGGGYYNLGGYYEVSNRKRAYRSYNYFVYEPSTSTEFTILTVESALYDLQTGEMIWAAILEVIDEVNIEKVFKDYVKVVTKDLIEKGLI